MKNKILAGVSLFLALGLVASPAMAAGSGGLIDVAKRKSELSKPEFAEIHKACMAQDISQPDKDMPKPIEGLKETDGYGTDRGMTEFSWFIMIHGGRALAGDKASADIVKSSLLTWADAKALSQTEEVHDAYYALKRSLLPMIVSYTIVRDDMSAAERKKVEDWIDPLVRRVDKKFDGDVDMNNHRYLADSVLTLWGNVIDDNGLYKKGKERFDIFLDQMQPDGALPLETRRGARGLWYIRQSIADMTLIAEVYERNGDNLYDMEKDGKSLSLLTNYFVSAVRSPLIILPDSSENYIPGPSDNFLKQDLAVLERRGGKRHYMAFSHLYLKHFGIDEFSGVRLNALMKETGFNEYPLIDDYIGGNATCFWGTP